MNKNLEYKTYCNFHILSSTSDAEYSFGTIDELSRDKFIDYSYEDEKSFEYSINLHNKAVETGNHRKKCFVNCPLGDNSIVKKIEKSGGLFLYKLTKIDDKGGKDERTF
jgi:hypothetical protein